MRRRIRGAVVAVCLAVPVLATAQQSVTLTPSQMRQVGFAALQAGDAMRASDVAAALLARDETDFAAHLIRARALRDLNRLDAAIASAKTAWRLADTPLETYSAALIRAQVLSSAGRRTAAQLWLRRAVQAAPDDTLRDIAVRDFQYVRARNPWLTQLSFSLTPSSNVNNGSTEDTSVLYDDLSRQLFGRTVSYSLDGASQALSGTVASAGATTRYRFDQSARHAHDVIASASYTLPFLSNDAKEIAPDAEGRDFAFGRVSLGLGTQRRNADRSATLSGVIDLGRQWYAGAPYADTLRLRGAYDRALTADTVANLTAERSYSFGIDRADATTTRLTGGLTHRTRSGHRVGAELSLQTAMSDDIERDYRQIGIGLRFSPDWRSESLRLETAIDLTRRTFDDTPHGPDGRQDDTIGAEVTAILPQAELYGFLPTVTIRHEDTRSNIGLYTSRSTGISLGLRSAF